MYAFKNIQLITKTGILEHQAVFFDTQIRSIDDENQVSPDVTILDGKGLFLAPGFIDMHIHGCAGNDTMDENIQAIPEIAKNIVKTGVTSFLPTTMTMAFPQISRTLERIRSQMKGLAGAQILGCHLEGPFISKEYNGAQDATFICDPFFSMIQPYRDVIRMVTLAPELAGSINFIKECRQYNIITSIGHSNATLDQATTAIHAGASHITHTFNAMSPLHHRNPGVVAAALLHNVTCELIADNLHVHPEIQHLLLKTKGLSHMVLITDAMRACLSVDGDYDLGGQVVHVRGNEARLNSGQLAGSVLTMNVALKNFIQNTGISIWEAVQLASFNSAHELGLPSKGSIEVGKDADLVLFDPDFNVNMTLVAGRIVYRRSN
jgi:N-acetylglucosamine-6-phosphate deacetylase